MPILEKLDPFEVLEYKRRFAGEHVLKNGSTLEENRGYAYQNLSRYVETPREQLLREHQIGVMDSLIAFLQLGKTSGYISLPTGSGKTILAAEIIQAIGLKTVILSPTNTIQDQTYKTIREFSPDIKITNYSGGEKDLSGDVLNTTYHSLYNLLRNPAFHPERYGLVIYDEAHTALGEQRHISLRRLTHVLQIGLTATPYFDQLRGYQERGLVDPDEPWLKLFQECIHEMTLEEAIERGVLTGLDVHLIRTNVALENIQIHSSGEYNRGQLERALNKEVRNFLTIAMIAGLDKIPPDVSVSDTQRREIELIHQKIKGKKTVVFGLSIHHIEQLADQLRSVGVRAYAVHGQLSANRRRHILDVYKEEKDCVLLGVDLLKLGWNSPETQVGIYLAPTRSGIVAVQELGRILRPCPDIGKDEAIAVQLVDEFYKGSQAPVLIPNIFDPYYVLRGTQVGKMPSPARPNNKSKIPQITFSGIEVNILIQEVKSKNILQNRLKQATLQEIVVALNTVAAHVLETLPAGASFLEFHRRIVEYISERVPREKQQEAQQALSSIDSNTVEIGRTALRFLSLRTLLTAIEPYLGSDNEENDDIFQATLGVVNERLKDNNAKSYVSQRVYYAARLAAEQAYADIQGVPVQWVQSGWKKAVLWVTGHPDLKHTRFLSDEESLSIAGDIGERINVDPTDVLKCMRGYADFDEIINEESSMDIVVEKLSNKQEVSEIVNALLPYEAKFVESRFGLDYGFERNYKEVSEHLGISPDSAKRYGVSTLEKMRHFVTEKHMAAEPEIRIQQDSKTEKKHEQSRKYVYGRTPETIGIFTITKAERLALIEEFGDMYIYPESGWPEQFSIWEKFEKVVEWKKVRKAIKDKSPDQHLGFNDRTAMHLVAAGITDLKGLLSLAPPELYKILQPNKSSLVPHAWKYDIDREIRSLLQYLFFELS